MGVRSGSRFGQFFLIAPRKRHCCLGLRSSRGKKRIVRLQCSPLQAARQHRRTGPSQNGCGCSSVDRVLASEAKGRGFDPRQPRQPCSHKRPLKGAHPQRAATIMCTTIVQPQTCAPMQGVPYGPSQPAHLCTWAAGGEMFLGIHAWRILACHAARAPCACFVYIGGCVGGSPVCQKQLQPVVFWQKTWPYREVLRVYAAT